MFEKEAKEYANREIGTIQNDEWKNCVLDWRNGAEYCYNKALEEATHNYNAIIADYDKRIAELEKENNEIHVRRNKDMETRKIVRANGAGVFFGEVVEENGDVVVMTNARRLWRWDGASSLSELAQYGTCRPDECKFPCAVDKVKIFNVIEILDVTEDAGKSIDGVKEWKQR